jgi:UDP-N-acetylglucosamine 4,6-dehydratase
VSIWKGATVLLTGATGSFGSAFLRHALDVLDVGVVRCYSRDELKQSQLFASLPREDRDRVRTLLGDVRDPARLRRALDGVSLVVHAAALKRVDAIAYDPIESVKTNIGGAVALVDAAIDAGVQRVVGISTDKGAAPANLYGATKMVMEHLFGYARAYAGGRPTRFCTVRYGNVLGSRGSVVPMWLDQARAGGPLTVTDGRMTRFWITLDQACALVAWAGEHAQTGETVIPALPRSRVVDMAEACAVSVWGESKSPPAAPFQPQLVGERPGGEKLHECLVTADEVRIAQHWSPLAAGLDGYRLRHGDVPRERYGAPLEPLHSDTAPLLDVAGCRALLERAQLVPAPSAQLAA